MKWEMHINNIVRKTKNLRFVFYNLKKLLSTKQLLPIYYGLFNSIAAYIIKGWGGVYGSCYQPRSRLQNKLLKIIGINEDNDDNSPLDMKQNFVWKAIALNYSELRNNYIEYQVNTRYKNLSLKLHGLKIAQRGYEYYSYYYFSMLLQNLKNLQENNKTIRKNKKCN